MLLLCFSGSTKLSVEALYLPNAIRALRQPESVACDGTLTHWAWSGVYI